MVSFVVKAAAFSEDDVYASSLSMMGTHQVVVSSSGLTSPVLRKRFCLTVIWPGSSVTVSTGKPIILIQLRCGDS